MQTTKSKSSSNIFHGAFLYEKIKNREFVNFVSRYTYYFLEYSKYFGRALRLLKSVYGMNNFEKLFLDELT